MRTQEIKQHYQGLNAIRLLLALLVAWSHSYPLTATPEPLEVRTGIISGGAIAVYAFFFISGFLVTRSWLISADLKIFIASRVLRIWPALIAALFFSVGISWIVSTAEIGQLLQGSIHFISHNVMLIYGIEYQIPGAFDGNPVSKGVNGSLWTLPWEIRAYLFVLLMGITGILANRATANAAILLALALLAWTSQRFGIVAIYDNPTVPFMLGAFLLGMLIAINQDHWSMQWIISALLAGALVLLTKHAPYMQVWGVIFLLGALVMAISIAPRFKFGDFRDDISYGVYVYAFPLQQLIVWWQPTIGPTQLFLLTTPILVLVAFFSWRLIERPCINVSKHFRKAVDLRKQRNATTETSDYSR